MFSDGEGLAVIGPPSAVERFMASFGLEHGVHRDFSGALRAGAIAAEVGSAITAETGRWVKLTGDSATRMHEIGLTPTKFDGVSHAMVGRAGDIRWLQIENAPGMASLLTNPAVLSGAAGVMAQFAMQQQMNEIQDYLERIDKKLDRVLRSQTNDVSADSMASRLAVREAMTVREAVGRVSEVTWSKVQTSAQTIHQVEGYTIRELSNLAQDIEDNERKMDDWTQPRRQSRGSRCGWSSWRVASRSTTRSGCSRLDRVLDASPRSWTSIASACSRHARTGWS